VEASVVKTLHIGNLIEYMHRVYHKHKGDVSHIAARLKFRLTLEQWFPIRVPRNYRVPPLQSRVSTGNYTNAKIDSYLLFSFADV